VARRLAGGLKRDCKRCHQLSSPENFAAGTNVRIVEVQGDQCDTCETFLSITALENENVVEIFSEIPAVFDFAYGVRVVTVEAILGLLNLFGVAEELREDYYKRIIFLHENITNEVQKMRDRNDSKESQQHNKADL
jgi:hypothetical protein